MPVSTVSRQCTATVTNGGRAARCRNMTRTLSSDQRPLCYLHDGKPQIPGAVEHDRRFSEVHTGGKYSWAFSPYPPRPGSRVVGGTSTSGISGARQALYRAMRTVSKQSGSRVPPMMLEVAALEAQESWTDFPEYGVTVRVWRVAD